MPGVSTEPGVERIISIGHDEGTDEGADACCEPNLLPPINDHSYGILGQRIVLRRRAVV